MTLQIDENVEGAVKVDESHSSLAKSIRQKTADIQAAAREKINAIIADAQEECQKLAEEGRADWEILRAKLGLSEEKGAGLHLDERTGFVVTTGDLRAHLIKTETGIGGEDLSGNDSDEVAQKVDDHLREIGTPDESIASTVSLKDYVAPADGTAPVADAPALPDAPAEAEVAQEPTSAGQAPAPEEGADDTGAKTLH